MLIQQLDRYELEPISAATRTVLCDFAAGDLERPLHRVQADWEEVFRGISRNGLLGLTFRYLRHWKVQDYPPPRFRQWVHQAYRLSAIRMAVTYRYIGGVLAQLAESGIDCMVVKGPAVAHRVYPDPNLRGFNDLDLVVRERDWAVTHQLLATMGFVSESNLPQPPPKLVPQEVVYEQVYWHPEKQFMVEVHYDDLLNAGLASRDVEGFWQRAVLVDVDGLPVKTLSLEDQLIQLCAHAHNHGYTRLGWFSDIAFIVRDHAEKLDWERMLETVRTEEAQVPVYYSLYFLERLLDISAPKDMLATLEPDRFRRWWHERYQPEERVLSLERIWPRPQFSFYFIPISERLLPDLLVMGRRPEKLRYLVRLLSPPRDWLIHYYSLNPSHVFIHYFLHPLKIFHHIVADPVRNVLNWAVSSWFLRARRVLRVGQARS